jgi:hypothetical protein
VAVVVTSNGVEAEAANLRDQLKVILAEALLR